MAVETFYLVDGHSQIFRAYYAPMQDLTAPSGEPTKATFVFWRMLLALLQQRQPSFLAVAIDGPEGATRRLDLHPDYKAERETMPEDLAPQIERIVELLERAGIPVIQSAGEEADDVLATCVEQLRHHDLDIYLVSRDKDLYQLLDSRVKLFDPQKDEVIDAASLMKTKGFRPDQAVEIQTLTGDKIDNIPGIPTVGVKKACMLIHKYGTAEAVVDHADELTPKLRENVLAFAAQLPLTRELVTLRRDCPIRVDPQQARSTGFKLEHLGPAFEELGFSSLRRSVEGNVETPAAPSAAEVVRDRAGSLRFEAVRQEHDLAQLADRLRRAGVFAVDTEATSLRPRDAELVGISFAWDDKGGVYVPVRSQHGDLASLDAVKAHIGPVLSDPEIGKVGQNLKYDLQILRRAGFPLRGITGDTMVASYLLNSERQSHGLDFLAGEFLNYEPIPITALIGKGPKQLPIEEADPNLMIQYAAEDANVAWRLWKAMEPALAERGLEKLFNEVEMPLVSVLADMEWHGVKLDVDLLATISREFGEKLKGLQDQIWKAAGRSFNVASPQQLGQVLFDDLGLPVVKRTKTSRSTDAEVLQALVSRTRHPLPGLVLRYRELSKLTSTYVDVLPSLVSPTTGRLHPSYHQAVAATGRLSASDPNIQNIPIRTEEGKRIRQAFLAEGPGSVLLTADYSQIELRILAHYSGDPALTAAFEAGEDIHRWVASRIWGMPPAEVPRNLRAQAKAVNFGIIYGQTAFGLARTLGIPRAEAARFIAAYKEKFQGITRFVERVLQEARDAGVVRTILGRQRPIPEIGSSNRTRRQQAERFAVNTVIQGSAADLIKAAMVAIHRAIETRGLAARMIIQVHDELVFETDEADVDSSARLVEDVMTSALTLTVPLEVDMAWGRSWLEGTDAAKG